MEEISHIVQWLNFVLLEIAEGGQQPIIKVLQKLLLVVLEEGSC